VTDASDYTIPIHGDSAICIMWQSKFAKTYQDELATPVGGTCSRDCWRRPINDSSPAHKPKIRTNLHKQVRRHCVGQL